jgi:uncharacterized membrane protein
MEKTKYSLDSSYQKAIEEGVGLITGVRDIQEYKEQKRTGNIEGTKVTVTIVSGEAVGEVVDIKVPVNHELAVGQQVKVKIELVKLYARTSSGSSYATVEASISGQVEVVK